MSAELARTPGTISTHPAGREDGREQNGVGNLMLVGDHACFRQALAFLLDRVPGLKTVAQTGTPAGARRLIDRDVHLTVLDLPLPDDSGTKFVKDIRRLNPEGLVLVLAAGLVPERLDRIKEAGASEILHKSVTVARIIATVRRLVRDGEGSRRVHGVFPAGQPSNSRIGPRSPGEEVD